MTKPNATTIKEIEDSPIYGNHYMDHHLWSELDKILIDETKDITLRAAASKKIDNIVGDEIIPMSDEDRVAQHILDLQL